MPSLPRLTRRRTRGPVGPVVARPRAEPAELHASGVTWIHVDAPDVETAQALAERFGWHPLDVEDVLSKRQRPKVDEYVEDGYLLAILHFPVWDPAIQRLNAGELDVFLGSDYLVTLSNVYLPPVTRLFRRCQEDEVLRHQKDQTTVHPDRHLQQADLGPDPRRDRKSSLRDHAVPQRRGFEG